MIGLLVIIILFVTISIIYFEYEGRKEAIMLSKETPEERQIRVAKLEEGWKATIAENERKKILQAQKDAKNKILQDQKDEKKRLKQERKRLAMMIRCPKCGSTNITPFRETFGVGKAAVGAAFLGPVGLLGGFIGSKPVFVCLDCRKQFKK